MNSNSLTDLNNYCNFLDKYTALCAKKSSLIGNKTKSEEPYKYLLSQILHINGSISSISLLLKSIHTSPHHFNQIYLILRNIITIVSLTYAAILNNLQEGDDKDFHQLKKNISKIKLDHLTNIERFIKKNSTNVLLWNQDKVSSSIKEIEITESELKPFNKKFSTKTTDAFNYIIDKENNQSIKLKFCYLFERWDTFSKIEHPGYISSKLFNNQFSIESFDENVAVILRIINFTIDQQLYYLSFWTQEEFDDLKSLYDKLKRL
jgi:hypothetical protein